MAKERDQWLLVNVQRDTEFQCHLLNRCFICFATYQTHYGYLKGFLGRRVCSGHGAE